MDPQNPVQTHLGIVERSTWKCFSVGIRIRCWSCHMIHQISPSLLLFWMYRHLTWAFYGMQDPDFASECTLNEHSLGAGLVLMQLAVPRLRSSSALRSFNRSLQNLRCDLNEWRVRERLPASQTTALDADNGAGWDLAQALLRPRKVEVRPLSCQPFAFIWLLWKSMSCCSFHFLFGKLRRLCKAVLCMSYSTFLHDAIFCSRRTQ